MRISNNFNGLNILEDLKSKLSNPASKNKQLRSNQNPGPAHPVQKPEFSGLGPDRKSELAEIIEFEAARNILDDAGEQILKNPNDLILAQAHHKPEAVLKLIS